MSTKYILYQSTQKHSCYQETISLDDYPSGLVYIEFHKSQGNPTFSPAVSLYSETSESCSIGYSEGSVSLWGTELTLDFMSYVPNDAGSTDMYEGLYPSMYITVWQELDDSSGGSGSDTPVIDEMVNCDIIFSECGLLWLENIRFAEDQYDEYNNFLKKITYTWYNSDGSALYAKTKSREYYDYPLQPLLFVDFAHDENGNITAVPDSVDISISFEFSKGSAYNDIKHVNYATTLSGDIWGKEKICVDINSAKQINDAEIEVKYKSYFKGLGIYNYDTTIPEYIFDAMNGDSGLYLTFSFLHSGGEAIQKHISWGKLDKEYTFILNAIEIYKNIPSAISGEVSVSTNSWYDLNKPVVDIVCMTKTFTLDNWPSIIRFHFKNIADAIREKTGKTNKLTIREMIEEMYTICISSPDDYPIDDVAPGYENSNIIECVKIMASLLRRHTGGGEEVFDTPIKLEEMANRIKDIV